jgi:hypothetical protein
MRQLLLTDWHIVRLLRLVLGVWIGVSAIQKQDVLLGFISTFLLWQAISNTGCCGTSGCSAPQSKANQPSKTEVNFEEIKTK